MVRVGETDFPREEHIYWLSGTKWSSLKPYIQIASHNIDRAGYVRQSRLCSRIYTCMYVTTINEKEATNLKTVWNGVLEDLEGEIKEIIFLNMTISVAMLGGWTFKGDFHLCLGTNSFSPPKNNI